VFVAAGEGGMGDTRSFRASNTRKGRDVQCHPPALTYRLL
jgi:hypothetical protein